MTTMIFDLMESFSWAWTTNIWTNFRIHKLWVSYLSLSIFSIIWWCLELLWCWVSWSKPLSTIKSGRVETLRAYRFKWYHKQATWVCFCLVSKLLSSMQCRTMPSSASIGCCIIRNFIVHTYQRDFAVKWSIRNSSRLTRFSRKQSLQELNCVNSLSDWLLFQSDPQPTSQNNKQND